MKQINDFGIFCRKLRLDNNQILKEMADALGVSSSYLSAVENNKRKINTFVIIQKRKFNDSVL